MQLMKKFNPILCFLGWFNILPVNILAWLFFFIPHLIKGSFEDVQFWPDGSISWDVKNDSDLFKRLKKDNWWGFVIGSNIVMVDYDPKSDDAQFMMHERAHVYQNYALGVLFYPVYIAITVWLYFFKISKHPYLDNPFEIQARRYAGQKVIIPIEEWSSKTNDRWPWW